MEIEEITFESFDKLNRKAFAENIMETINNYNEIVYDKRSLVVSLDAPWGSGKTKLIQMWINMLNSDERYSTFRAVHYNAWESDDWDDPFIPILSCIKKEYSDNYDEQQTECFFEKASVLVKAFFLGLTKNYLKKYIPGDLGENISESLGCAAEKEVGSDYSKGFLTYVEEKNNFSEALDLLTPPNGKLIIFIDELDRCRPDFAIKTLEIIKHFFNNKNIVFVISVDMKQLSYSISTIYGYGMDSVGYLRRFIDVSFRIPLGNIEQYTKCKFNAFANKTVYAELNSNLLDSITHMYRKLGLSLRDIDKVSEAIISFLLFYKRQLSINKNAFDIYLYFLILKYKHPNTFELILHNRFSLDKIVASDVPVLENKYIINGPVHTLLKEIALKGAQQCTDNYIERFGLFKDENLSRNLGEHIEYIIELFC